MSGAGFSAQSPLSSGETAATDLGCTAHAGQTGTCRRPMTNGDEGLVTNLPLASHKAPVATEWLSNEYKTALSGLLAAGYNIRAACEGSGGSAAGLSAACQAVFMNFMPRPVGSCRQVGCGRQQK